jgi:hypothetical protein
MEVHMKLFSTLFAVSAIALASMSANAELISTDWKTTGDALATLDDETGLEWLDLTQTRGYSYNSISPHLNGTYSGWRFPTTAEMQELFAHVFPTIDTASPGYKAYGENPEYYQTFLSAFGATYRTNSYGYYRQDGSNEVTFSGVNSSFVHGTDAAKSSLGTSNVRVGLYLVSNGGTTLSSINDPSINIGSANVPLPATAALLGLSLLGFAARRKNNG